MTALEINPIHAASDTDWGEVVDLTARRAASSTGRPLDPVASLRAAAERHYVNQNYATARDLLEQLVEKLDPYEHRSELCRHYCRLACIAEVMGSDEEAIELYLQSFEFDTTYVPTLQGLAAVLLRKKRWNNARRFFQIIIIQHRDLLTKEELVEAHCGLGEIYRRLEQLDRSREHYKKVLELDPENVAALRAWSELAMLREDWEEAFETRERLFSIDTGEVFEELLEQAKLCTEKLGDPFHAIDIYNRARVLRPKDERVLRALVDLYDETSQTKKKIRMLEALAGVVEASSKRRDLYTELARAWVEQDDMIEAIDCLNRALDEDPSFVEAFEEIEKFLFEARDWARLAATYRRMIKRIPKDQTKARAILWQSLGTVYEKGLKNDRGARVAYETVLRSDPGSIDIALRLAEVYSHARDTAPKAIEIYQDLLKKVTDPVVPTRKLFELYSGLDQLDRAYCALGALILMGAASETEREAYALLQKRLPKAPTGSLDDADWRAHLLHPECRSSLADLATILYRGAPSSFMESQRRLGLRKKERIDPNSARARLRFFDVCANVRATLSIDEVEHYHRAGSKDAPTLLPGSPPVMYAGESHDSFGAMKTCQLRWMVARELASARPEIAPAFALAPEDLAAAMEAAVTLVNESGSGIDLGIDPKRIRTWRKELSRHLSASAMKELKATVAVCIEKRDMANLAGYIEGAEQTAYRAALLLAQDCAVVNEEDPARVRDLALFSVSEEHFALREKLAMTIGS